MIGTLICLISVLIFLLPQPPIFEALGYLGGGDLYHAYQLLTYMFCHASLSHLGFNLLILVPSCWYLEQEIGWKRTALLCALSAAAGALLWDYAVTKSAFYLLTAGQPRVLIGASAVASGTTCAGLLVLAQRQQRLAAPCYLMLLAVFGANLSDALAAQAAPLPVAYWGHIGGYLVGLFMAPSLCQPVQLVASRRRR
jgi:membrane associated rhomboid family serine protease